MNVADALVQMISLARQFEMQTKLMHTIDQNEQASSQLLRLNG